MKCQFRWGQVQLFPADQRSGGSRRYRVFDGSSWGPTTTSLALATAQARAAALAGRSALVWDDDGSGVTVTRMTAGAFAVVPDPGAPWADLCRSLLNRYG